MHEMLSTNSLLPTEEVLETYDTERIIAETKQ